MLSSLYSKSSIQPLTPCFGNIVSLLVIPRHEERDPPGRKAYHAYHRQTYNESSLEYELVGVQAQQWGMEALVSRNRSQERLFDPVPSVRLSSVSVRFGKRTIASQLARQDLLFPQLCQPQPPWKCKLRMPLVISSSGTRRRRGRGEERDESMMTVSSTGVREITNHILPN